MNIRTRKLIGIVACVAFLTLYCLVAMAIGGAFMTDRPAILQLGYYVVAGIAWLPVVMALIRWMQGQPSEE